MFTASSQPFPNICHLFFSSLFLLLLLTFFSTFSTFLCALSSLFYKWYVHMYTLSMLKPSLVIYLSAVAVWVWKQCTGFFWKFYLYKYLNYMLAMVIFLSKSGLKKNLASTFWKYFYLQKRYRFYIFIPFFVLCYFCMDCLMKSKDGIVMYQLIALYMSQ